MLDVEAAKKNPFAPGLFTDKVALITGGGTGIGFAVAREMLDLGAKVIICSRKAEHLDPAAAELGKRGVVMSHLCDIREPVSVEETVKAALDRFGRIDVLINNAGGQFPSPAAGITTKGWDAVIRNNLNGTFYMTR